jgi:hypothetical protein
MGLIENIKFNDKKIRRTISIALIFIGFLAFPYFVFFYMSSIVSGLYFESVSISYVFLALFFVFVSIILILLATEIKRRFILASAMAFFLLFICLIMSFTFLGIARSDLEISQEFKEDYEKGLISQELYEDLDFEPRFSEHTLISFEQLNLSGIIISSFLGIVTLVVYINLYFKNKKQTKVSVQITNT